APRKAGGEELDGGCRNERLVRLHAPDDRSLIIGNGNAPVAGCKTRRILPPSGHLLADGGSVGLGARILDRKYGNRGDDFAEAEGADKGQKTTQGHGLSEPPFPCFRRRVSVGGQPGRGLHATILCKRRTTENGHCPS